MPKETSEQLAQGSGVPNDRQMQPGVKVPGWPLRHPTGCTGEVHHAKPLRREFQRYQMDVYAIGSVFSDKVPVWDPDSDFFAEACQRAKFEFCIAAEVIQMPGTTGQF
ncbi:unnamed protein product [Bubo scandiacus]